MAAISLRLLGTFEARGGDGRPIKLPGRRSVAVLACLADDDSGSWSRERLAQLLWAGRGATQARNSLRQELVRLRQALLEAVGPLPELWQAAETLAMPPEIFDVDLRRLRGAAADPARADVVAELYRGELLQDFVVDETPFGVWLGDRRRRLRQMVVDSLLSALRDAGTGEDDGVERRYALARRVIDIEPANEEGHRWLIGFHRRRGEAAKAIEQFRWCEEALLRDLGTTPSAATINLLSGLSAARPSGARAPWTVGDGVDWIEWVKEAAPTPRVPEPPPLTAIDDRPSLVVLPFADLAERDARDDILAPGLTEETTDALSRVPGLFVIARHSAMNYPAGTDVRRAAAELGVRYLVEGSVLHDATRLRVNLRLIDGRTGTHLWADSHERPLTALMDLRDTVVRDIAARLDPQLHAAEMRRALERAPASLDAWGWLQRAHSVLMGRRREDALSEALPLLRRALDIDPTYGMAHAMISAVRTWRANSLLFPEQDEDRRLARLHGQEALHHDRSNAYVLSHCAETALYSAAAIDMANMLLDEAIQRNPADPYALASAGNARRFAGEDPAECIKLLEQAMRLSPRDTRSFNWHHYAGWCHWKLGDYVAMEVAARRALELYSGNSWSWVALVTALGLQERRAEAARAAQAMLGFMPQFSPIAFFEVARGFYGDRFPGEVERNYARLTRILEHAIADIKGGALELSTPRVYRLLRSALY